MKIDGKKFLKRLGWTLVCLVTLVALFYAIENWRGARAWDQARTRLIDEGEPMTFAELVPEPISPELNFCAIPLIASLTNFDQVPSESGEAWDFDVVYRDPETRNRFLTLKLPGKGDQPKFPDAKISRPIDLDAWVAYLESAEGFELGDSSLPPAERILAAYQKFEPLLDEISQATHSRPGAQFPFSPGETYPEMIGMAMPHIHDIMSFSKFLVLRSSAAIAAGKTDLARDAILIQLRLAEASGSQPTLIGHLVRLTLLHNALNSIWEGLRQRAWSDEDLRWIEEQLHNFELSSSTLRAFRGEHSFYLSGIHYLKTLGSGELIALTGGSNSNSAIPYRMTTGLIPTGWLDQNAALGSTLLYESCILPMKERDFASIYPFEMSEALGSMTPYNFFARLALPAIQPVLVKSVHAEAMLNLARTACALDRFRLEHQKFPDRLEELNPGTLASIPVDPMNQKPLVYQRIEDSFLLYSIGWNQADDSGETAMKRSQRQDLESGDWVWRY